MEGGKKKQHVFQIECPCCHSLLWVDSFTHDVIKSEKGKKKKGSLDDLLLKEKKKREEFERKFEATSEMQKERRKKAQEIFEKVFTDIGKEED